MKAIFKYSEKIAENTYTFWFSKPERIYHIAGQYTELYLPHENPDERGERRWFTLSSSPTEKMLSITTKFNHPSSSYKNILKDLKPGTELFLAEPMGDFVLPKDPSIPLVFIAGGIGCTPYRSIIKFLHDTRERRNIILIYNVRNSNEVAFSEIFSRLENKFIKVIGTRLTGEKILQFPLDTSSSYIYLSGPEIMVERLFKELISRGVDKKHLQTDFFHGYLEP